MWRSILDDFDIDDSAGLSLLESALRCWDRAHECRDVIDKEGLQIRDRFEQLKPHPLLASERDAWAGYRAALKQLNLDVLPPGPVGRPAGG